MVTEEGMGRTCAGSAVERIDAEYEAYFDGERQGEHDPERLESARGGGKQARGGAREREGGGGRTWKPGQPSQLEGGSR